MHIALVTHRFTRGDGQGRVNLEVAQEAVHRGWTVTLVSTDEPQLALSERVRWLRVGVAWCPTALLRYQLFALASALKLRRIRRDVDLVVVNGFITWARADFNAVHYVHGAWLGSPYRRRNRSWSPRNAYQELFTRVNARLEKHAFARTGEVIAVSDTVRRQLVASGVDEPRIHVIPNGVDTGEFHPGAADRAGLGIPAGRVAGIFVGQLKTPHKNLGTVLKALALVPGVHLVVVGAIGQSHYPRLAGELGIAARVHFLGYRRDVAALMRTADFFMCPSLHDSNPLVLLEGLATGLPVITARTVGGSELLGRECAFVLEDPEDVPGMARAIGALAGSAELRGRMSEAARAKALTLDFTTMAQRYCELFERYPRARPAPAGYAAPGAGVKTP